MTKRRRKAQPSTPADIVARRVERRQLEARGLEVNTDPRTEEITGIWRKDCFTMLLRDRPAESQAVTWLETVIRTAAGENGQERRPDFIRATVEGAPCQNVTGDMIDAGETLVVIEEAMNPREVRMLFELLRPDEALLTRWRPVVERCTGETNPQAQGAAVRAACANLAHVRDKVPRLTEERRARRKLAA